MTNETFRTIPNREISLTTPSVIEFEQGNYCGALVFPIAMGFDGQKILNDALLNRLFVNVTTQQLKDLRDVLNNLNL